MSSSIDVAEYCREIETHLCRKNDGHLVRVVGPSFDVVSGWATRGVPLKVALGGIDRYFERYYRKGTRRRPVKIDFCEGDVLDVFDEWRRATGVTPVGNASSTTNGDVDSEVITARKTGPSLPDHLQRVLTRLSSLRASGALPDAAEPLLDAVSAAFDAARARSGGVRGDERRALIAQLDDLDRQLLTLALANTPADVIALTREDATRELASYRATMAPEAFERAVERAASKAVRQHLGFPTISFT